jgi:cysteine-S-conjugate beta-lyase
LPRTFCGTFYPPTIGAGIESLFRKNTLLVWCESLVSITMEVQDVPAIVDAAHRVGAMIVLDNTWSAGVYFDAFAHGVDVSMQALTKYVGGHSDLLLGSITVRDKAAYKRLGSTHQLVGCAASPDDCSLALRGMETLAVRLKALGEAASRSPAGSQSDPRSTGASSRVSSCPGHEFWKRDFTGSAGLFSIVLQRQFTKPQVHRFVDALELFEMGYSWAGVTSLAVGYDFHSSQSRPDYGHRIVRLNIGLEDVDHLKADLARAGVDEGRCRPPLSCYCTIYGVVSPAFI